MNLGKLLGAGKSFFGGRGTVSYRENKRVYLPKFNGEKNPFSPKAAEPAAAAALAVSFWRRRRAAPAVTRKAKTQRGRSRAGVPLRVISVTSIFVHIPLRYQGR